MRTYRKLSQFQIDDEVRFTGPDGKRISGHVVRVNKKTVSLVTPEGDHWNVASAFLRKARSDREEAQQPQNVIAFRGR